MSKMNKYEEVMLKRFGSRYAEYRKAYKTKKMSYELKFPLEIDLDVIDSCNLKCPTCHSIGRVRSHHIMSEELIQRIADECAQYNMPAINIGGCSEPLLNKELTLKAIDTFQKAGVMDIFLHTNGLLLSEDVSKSLIESGVTYLCVSIDAHTSEAYQKIRGNKRFSDLIRNIEKFLQIRGESVLPALRVSFLATSSNISEKDAFIEFWKDKADFVDVQNYAKSYDSQPDELYAHFENTIIEHITRKRMAIVAPDYLCVSCGGLEVTKAVEMQHTLSKYKTIKQYWEEVALKYI